MITEIKKPFVSLNGRGGEIRTPDILLPKDKYYQLYQLYTDKQHFICIFFYFHARTFLDRSLIASAKCSEDRCEYLYDIAAFE